MICDDDTLITDFTTDSINDDDFEDGEDCICAPKHIDTASDNEEQTLLNVTGHPKYSKKKKKMNSPKANENDLMKSLATIISKPTTEHVSLKQTEPEEVGCYTVKNLDSTWSSGCTT